MNTREKLVSTAIELMLKQGYSSVGVQDICQQAAVKKGSFYHFFASKSDLALEAVRQHWESYKVPIVQCATAPISPFARVELLFTHLHRQHQAKLEQAVSLTGCPFATLAMEVSIHDLQLRHALSEVFLAWSGIFEQIFADAVQLGESPANTDPKRAAQALLAYLEGILLLVKTTQNPELLLNLKPSFAMFQSFGQEGVV